MRIGHVLMIFAAIAAATAIGFAETHVTATDVAPVWAGHRVAFALITDPPYQYVAYYNADRQMTVAMRTLDSHAWTFQPLPEYVKWDSHNSIRLAVDSEGHLHLSGNMHVNPLVYFLTTKLHDVTSMERVQQMVGREEDRCTYPAFLTGPNNEFIFTYRDGSSGSGNQIYNVYDVAAKTWSRLLDSPLVDGKGEMNAYFVGPLAGPDGYFHLCWIWRDTPDCATNHDICYARSKDLRHWETSTGEALALPITYATCEIVDPVPVNGGAINGNTKIGFDLEGRVVLSYHKFDANGLTQLYNARLENGRWTIYKSSDWDYRWEFSGGGSIQSEIGIGPVTVQDGMITQQWSHSQYGSQRWRLDPETLEPIEKIPSSGPHLPAAYGKVESSFPGMTIQGANDSGESGEAGVTYRLRWETLGPNRDKPRPEPWPSPSMLRVLRIEEKP